MILLALPLSIIGRHFQRQYDMLTEPREAAETLASMLRESSFHDGEPLQSGGAGVGKAYDADCSGKA